MKKFLSILLTLLLSVSAVYADPTTDVIGVNKLVKRSDALPVRGKAYKYLPQVSVAPSWACGSILAIPGYKGPLFTLLRSGISLDLYADGNGNPNVNPVLGFARSATANINVKTCHDQVGGNDATQSNSSLQPYFSFVDKFNGLYSITFDGSVSSILQLIIPSTLTGSGQNTSILDCIYPLDLMATNVSSGTIGAAYNTAGSITLLPGYGGGPSKYTILTPSNFEPTGQARTQSLPQCTLTVSGPSGIRIYQNDYTSGLLTATSAGTWSGGSIGLMNGSTYPFYGEFYFRAIYPGQLTANDAALIMNWANHRLKINTSRNTNAQIVIPGDSLVEATDSTNNQSIDRQMYPLLKRPAYIRNNGIFGQAVATIYANRGLYSAQFNSAFAYNILVAEGGSNDVNALVSGSIVGGGATIFNSYTLPFVQAMQAAGFTVVVPTIIPRNWTGSSTDISQKQAEAVSFNNLVISNAAANGYIVADYTSLSQFNSPATSWSSAIYYANDGIHLTNLGYSLLAQLLAKQINTMY